MAHSQSPDSIARFRAAHAGVLARIAEACDRVGRDPAEVTLLPVSKSVPADRLRDAVAAGLTLLGENRVQEAESKAELLPEVRWHLIGPLQSNKARRAVELFDTIESVDSIDLARRLDRLAGELGRRLTIYLQVNVDLDEAKFGFDPHELRRVLPAVLDLSNLDVVGLMTVGRLVETAEQARPTFVALRALSELLRGQFTPLGGGLSMGMSLDYAVAVEEGATLVRVGREIFGERPPTAMGR